MLFGWLGFRPEDLGTERNSGAEREQSWDPASGDAPGHPSANKFALKSCPNCKFRCKSRCKSRLALLSHPCFREQVFFPGGGAPLVMGMPQNKQDPPGGVPPSPSSLAEQCGTQTKWGAISSFSSPKLQRISGKMGTAMPRKYFDPLNFLGSKITSIPRRVPDRKARPSRAGESPPNGEGEGLPRGLSLVSRLIELFSLFSSQL